MGIEASIREEMLTHCFIVINPPQLHNKVINNDSVITRCICLSFDTDANGKNLLLHFQLSVQVNMD